MAPRKERPIPVPIKTAEQWQRELRMMEVNPMEDIRDDVISLVRNSGVSFQEIEARGGPKANTLYRWEDKKTKNPQVRTIRDTLRIIGKDLYVGRKL